MPCAALRSSCSSRVRKTEPHSYTHYDFEASLNAETKWGSENWIAFSRSFPGKVAENHDAFAFRFFTQWLAFLVLPRISLLCFFHFCLYTGFEYYFSRRDFDVLPFIIFRDAFSLCFPFFFLQNCFRSLSMVWLGTAIGDVPESHLSPQAYLWAGKLLRAALSKHGMLLKGRSNHPNRCRVYSDNVLMSFL